MPVIRLILIAFILVATPNFAHAMDAQGDSYEEMLARLTAGDTDIDYAAFRYAYAMSDGHNPYSLPPLEEMYTAAEQGDHATAVAVANEILESNYTDMDAHIVAFSSYNELGDNALAGHHWMIAHGLRNSIVSSGDGLSPDTAYVVMSVYEQSAYLRSEGLITTAQALTTNSSGAEVDAITVVDSETGDSRPTIYFDVSASFVWIRRNLFGGQGDPTREGMQDTP